jgi:hypothetical protein
MIEVDPSLITPDNPDGWTDLLAQIPGPGSSLSVFKHPKKDLFNDTLGWDVVIADYDPIELVAWSHYPRKKRTTHCFR